MIRQRWPARHRWVTRWLPVLGWMGLIFFLSAQPDLPHPETGWADMLFSSGAHVFVFGVLAFLWARALAERPRYLILTFCFVLLYAFSDEFHQAYVPGRTPDVVDLLCDGLGALLGLGFWVQARRWFRV